MHTVCHTGALRMTLWFVNESLWDLNLDFGLWDIDLGGCHCWECHALKEHVHTVCHTGAWVQGTSWTFSWGLHAGYSLSSGQGLYLALLQYVQLLQIVASLCGLRPISFAFQTFLWHLRECLASSWGPPSHYRMRDMSLTSVIWLRLWDWDLLLRCFLPMAPLA